MVYDKIYELIDTCPNDAQLGVELRKYYELMLKSTRCFHKKTESYVERGSDITRCKQCGKILKVGTLY